MTLWRLPPASFALGSDEAHVWRIFLKSFSAHALSRLLGLLSPTERERSARFRFDIHRERYIASTGSLRILLGRYLNADPASLQFRTAERGKPYISADGAPPLQFNLTHSGDLALAAMAVKAELGVDVEQHREPVASGHVAERFFSTAEVAYLRTLPKDEQVEAFFRIWTRKEAFLKANGIGLSYGLGEFTVSVDDPPALLETRRDPAEARRWSLVHLDPAPGYSGALALPAGTWTLRYWQFPLEWAENG